MILTSAMHRVEPVLLHPQTSLLSNRFDCSIHNCLCKKSKIGLVLYPKDTQMKNTILLVCEQCYNYKFENDTQHVQLEKWYFNIYKDSKSFHFKSNFSQNEDGLFCFHSAILNTNDIFYLKERELENWEKETIQRIVQKKLRDEQ